MKNIINKSYTETKKYKEDEAGEEEGVEVDNQEGRSEENHRNSNDQKKLKNNWKVLRGKCSKEMSYCNHITFVSNTAIESISALDSMISTGNQTTKLLANHVLQ